MIATPTQADPALVTALSAVAPQLLLQRPVQLQGSPLAAPVQPLPTLNENRT